MAKGFSVLLGIVLFGVGLWGTFTGGHDHLLLMFGVNATHNLVHLVSGALALMAAVAGMRYAKLFCLAFGAVYATVAVAGFANVAPMVQALNLNNADNLLHAGIGVVCLWVGVASRWED